MERTLWHNLGSMTFPTAAHQWCRGCGKFVLISRIWSSVRSHVAVSTLLVVFQTCSLMASYMSCVSTVDVNFRFWLNLKKFLCHSILTEVILTGFKRTIPLRELWKCKSSITENWLSSFIAVKRWKKKICCADWKWTSLPQQEIQR